MAAGTVVVDLVAVPVVDSAAADWVAVEVEDLLDFAALMVEDGAAQKSLVEHAALERHGVAVEEVQTIPRPRLEEPWAIWVAPAVATRDRLSVARLRLHHPRARHVFWAECGIRGNCIRKTPITIR